MQCLLQATLQQARPFQPQGKGEWALPANWRFRANGQFALLGSQGSCFCQAGPLSGDVLKFSRHLMPGTRLSPSVRQHRPLKHGSSWACATAPAAPMQTLVMAQQMTVSFSEAAEG